MAAYQHIVATEETNFELRPWGGYMCFLAIPERVNCKELAVGAVLRMRSGLSHEAHVHDDCDEILFVLEGIGRQSFWDEDGKETSYDIRPGDVVYIAKNRRHFTNNLSAEKELRLFIINYCVEDQSDPHIPGLIPAASRPAKPEAYGSAINVICEETCGNQSIRGDFLTLEPEALFQPPSVSKEELVFVLNGKGEIFYKEDGNEKSGAFPEETLGFFHKGESYSVKNTSDVPMGILRLRTK